MPAMMRAMLATIRIVVTNARIGTQIARYFLFDIGAFARVSFPVVFKPVLLNQLGGALPRSFSHPVAHGPWQWWRRAAIAFGSSRVHPASFGHPRAYHQVFTAYGEMRRTR